jgi:hypothetical protein
MPMDSSRRSCDIVKARGVPDGVCSRWLSDRNVGSDPWCFTRRQRETRWNMEFRPTVAAKTLKLLQLVVSAV